MIRLLIVDDSALVRTQLAQLFAEEGGFEIAQARNGAEAVEQVRALHPDVITLDINMPQMDGLTALSLIMTERPTPVVMVSSLTEQGALVTLEALHLGAVDYIAKPGGTISRSFGDIRRELVAKVRAAAGARLRHGEPVRARPAPHSSPRATPAPAPSLRPARRAGLVLIGVSTGGPKTLEDILPDLPADFPWPVVIAQHMPAAFTRSFAERLDRVCPLKVVEAATPVALEPGCAYVAKGGADLVVADRAGRLFAVPKPENPAFAWHPSVEVLARSALQHCPAQRLVAVMLTGMGNDGADGFAEIRQRGGRTIAESAETAIVHGMPRELILRDGAEVVLPAQKIADQLNRWAAGG
ncbi:chemotaxis-specific protein-glutamate methyltransferase CheB [Sphingomonas changnyeongensis]|uniref:Protein-glutamate methylesterase/protein-glutamine glutaminase n=1 Tax=Sphingomonas changnyeongensis TaxID=2698679 RepID=A0A7Z2NUF2_9SPHN|nr:chemotaxis response regulator protein-glutamate methylesterase [Sphingomonas changnyeongensis]QHL89635.1 chemotaxis-specific protein-glutamate methyltransferase CheB [Sphingomonas changnyeongensis]